LVQLESINEQIISELHKGTWHKDGDLMWHLLQPGGSKLLEAGVKGSRWKQKARRIASDLSRFPQIEVVSTSISQEMDKANQKGRGILMVKLSFQLARKPSAEREFASLHIILGTLTQRRLLGTTEISLRQQRGEIEKRVEFDWDQANADAGSDQGSLVLRLVHDSYCGLDTEMLVRFS